MIYLDYAATTPISREALGVYSQAASDFFGNPSSLHDTGSKASQLLETSREQLAQLIHGDKEGVYFTSGGSESNILALQSLIDAHQDKGNHLITTYCEHSSVYHFFQKMEKQGYEVTYLPVDHYGLVDIHTLESAIRDTTVLVSIQFVNGEVGIMQPIDQIGKLLKQKNILFHCDAVQAFGKIPIHVTQAHIDSLSVSSHKIYGPKGVGAVYINPKKKWKAQIPKTTHEKGFRPGTINVPGIAAFVTAAKSVCDRMEDETERIRSLRKSFLDQIKTLPIKFVVEEHPSQTLPHVLGLRIPGIEGQYTMLECNRYGVAISTGSACQVGNQEPLRTLKEMGRTDIEAKNFIRLSFGKNTEHTDIQQAVQAFQKLTENFFSKQGGTK
ncbi:IscS subfamily cysteine desulfurase [Salinibacillus xinjiangensis]|uniref:Aminotransferase class V-fold PLP-dependent enzyme n=1 Tax=Salinibacillus xinjiangensis TaxID=1229268 RepID=A0A6G1X4A8_9BACI|nr:IscS subfamily cysteine desulfurase [Salinibacillus xinjiangensis]MRG85759.1 aminotransferase class V-fold PLP-dependent enzyme [Salinibacillus xinjiangensis]